MTATVSQANKPGERPCDCNAVAHLEPMLTTEEVGKFLRVPVDTLYAWRHQGDGPKGHRMGKHLRFYRDDVLAFVASKKER